MKSTYAAYDLLILDKLSISKVISEVDAYESATLCQVGTHIRIGYSMKYTQPKKSCFYTKLTISVLFCSMF